MRDCTKGRHYERSNIIPIQQNSNISININKQYDLKRNTFDPSKSSPPNDFMNKLKLRISIYDYDYDCSSFSKNGAIRANE